MRIFSAKALFSHPTVSTEPIFMNVYFQIWRPWAEFQLPTILTEVSLRFFLSH